MSKILGLSIVVLGLAVSSSGCLSGFGADAPDEIGAMALLETAEDLADMGHDGALLAVFTLETADGGEFAQRSPPDWLLPFLNVTDNTVGNGLAPAWGFYFGAMMMPADEGDGHAHAGGENLLIIVAADRELLYRGAVPMDFPVRATTPLGTNWTIDSDKAAANARDTDLMETLGGAGTYSFASLAIRIGSPAAWIFEAGQAGSGEGATVAADARDGLKIRLGSRDPFAPIKTESGELQGTATSAGTKSNFAIEWPSHRQLEFFLEIADSGGGITQTGAQLEFVAKGPGGQEFPFHWDGSGGTNQAWFQFEAPNPGAWTVEARLVSDATEQETSQAFTVTWCALGATRC